MNTALVAAAPRGSVSLRSIAGRIGLLPALLVVLVAGMSAVDAQFYGIVNVLNILRNASLLAIVACGQALVIIGGGFDLSVGAVVALASVVTAKTMAATAASFPGSNALIIASGVAAGLGCGVAVGLVNGFCVAKLKVSGFVVTLGTMSATAGVGLMITNGIPVYGMPETFVKGFGRAQAFGLPTAAHIALIVILVMVFAQRRTLFGRYVYAIGGNAEAARRGGVNLARIRTVAFMLASLTAGIGGIVYASRLRSVSTSYDGGTLVLYAVAAAVIGGTSLFGGRGKVLHGVLGGLVIAAIDNGMGLQGYSAPAKYVVTALVLVAAVTIDAVARRGRASS